MTVTSKAVAISSYGKPSQVADLTEVAVPKPGMNEVLVNVKLRPINPADLFSLMGVYPGFRPSSLPATPGLEGVGVITEVGSAVTRVKVGQRVVPLFNTFAGKGSYQEYVVLSEEDVVVVPDNVSDASAAQAIVNPVTVIGMIEELQIPKGQYLLQSAAGSVLGRQVIQIAKSYGIKTINLVRRKAQVAELQKLGGDIVISTEGLDKPDDISQAIINALSGMRPYAAIDCVGGDLDVAITMSVRDGATVFIYGAMEGFVGTVHIPSLLFRNVTVKGYWLANTMHAKDAAGRRELVAQSLDYMCKGVFEPFSGQIFPMEKISEAIEVSRQTARGGKVLLSS